MCPICRTQSAGRIRTPRSVNGPDAASRSCRSSFFRKTWRTASNAPNQFIRSAARMSCAQHQPGVVEPFRGAAGGCPVDSPRLFKLFAHAQGDEVVSHALHDAPLAGQQTSQGVEKADHLPGVRAVAERGQVIVEGRFRQAGRVPAFPAPEVKDSDVGVQGNGGVVMRQGRMGLALGSQQAAQALVTAVQVVVYAREQTFGAARGGGGQGALEVRGRQGVVFPAEVQFPAHQQGHRQRGTA